MEQGQKRPSLRRQHDGVHGHDRGGERRQDVGERQGHDSRPRKLALDELPDVGEVRNAETQAVLGTDPVGV